MTKKCSVCVTEKSFTDFWKNKTQKDGFDNLCISCRKIASAKNNKKNRPKITLREKTYRHSGGSLRTRCKKYGISVEQYKAMLATQSNKCKICHSETKLFIDHCHKTGKVRGLLCNNCNLVLGSMKDNPALLIKAAAYLSEQTV